MSKIRSERAYAVEQFDRFEGLGNAPLSKARKAADIQNFRICSDGSLKKRTGYYTMQTFSNPVRGYWEGNVGTDYCKFVICSNKIYTIEIFSGSPVEIGTTTSMYGPAEFILYENSLYIPDAGGLLVYDAGAFVKAKPYVPLYGKNWNPSAGGDLNEPLNLLTNHIRVHYANTGGARAFSLPFYAKAIDKVLVNGSPVTGYSFLTGEKTLWLPAESTGVDVEIGMEIFLDADPVKIHTSEKGVVYTGKQSSMLCLYHSNAPYRIYCSTPITGSALEQCQAMYAGTKPLYFQNENILLAGTPQYPVNAICQYGSYLLAYSTQGVWKIECPQADGDAPLIAPLLTDFGCIAPEAAILCGGYPVVVNSKGVYLLRFSASEKQPPETIKISEDISEHLTFDILQNCIAREDTLHNELWLHHPSDEHKRIFVYNLDQKQWYTFTEFSVSRFIRYTEHEGFISDRTVYILSESMTTDAGNEICAVYQSGYCSFSHPEAKKRALRITLCADTNGATPTLQLESEHAERTLTLIGESCDCPEVFQCRLMMGRFRFVRYRISVNGQQDCRFYALSLYANL